MIKNFYIFRHGETDMNKSQRWQGQKFDLELNERGIEQAHSLAEKIKSLGIEVIYSSPLKRARKTAEIAASKISVPLYIDDNLKEGNFGVVEGLTKEESIARYKEDYDKWMSFDTNYLDDSFEGGETKRQMLNRFFSTLEKIAKSEHKNIGISAHGSLIINMMAKLGKSLDKIPNVEIYNVQYKNGQWLFED